MGVLKTKRSRVILTLLVLGLLVGVLVPPGFMAARRAARHASWSEDPWGTPDPYEPHDAFSDSVNERVSYLQNELLRRSAPWTMDDVEQIKDVIWRQTPDFERLRRLRTRLDQGDESAGPKLVRLLGEQQVWKKAIWVAATRLRKNRVNPERWPVEPGARAALEKTLISMLYDDRAMRDVGFDAMVTSGLVARPKVRQRIEEIATYYPVKDMRETMQRRLAHYDNIVELADKYRRVFHGSNGQSNAESEE